MDSSPSGVGAALSHVRHELVVVDTSTRNYQELVHDLLAQSDDGRRLENLSREGRAWVRRNHGYERHLELLESAYFGAAARVSEMPIAM